MTTENVSDETMFFSKTIRKVLNDAIAENYQGEIENEQLIEKVKKFMHDGCGCALGAKGGSCSLQFLETDVLYNLIVWNFQMMNWTW